MNHKPTADEIAADLFCQQVQTFADEGTSAFDHEDVRPDLEGDEWADYILSTMAWQTSQSVL